MCAIPYIYTESAAVAGEPLRHHRLGLGPMVRHGDGDLDVGRLWAGSHPPTMEEWVEEGRKSWQRYQVQRRKEGWDVWSSANVNSMSIV